METPIRAGDPHNPYYIKSVTNERGYTTTYTRPDPATHLITQIDYPDGGVETFDHNSAGQVIKHQRRNGYYEYAEYDPTGLLTKLWNPTAKASKDQLTAGDPFTSFSYYTTGPWKDRVQTVTDPLGYRATYEYDVDANGAAVYGRGLVTKISYPDDTHNGTIPGGTSQSISYDSWGNKLTEADEMNHATIHIYDDYSRLLTTKLRQPRKCPLQLPPTITPPRRAAHLSAIPRNHGPR